MQENPYDAIAQLLDLGKTGLFLRLGTVLAADPLAVDVGGLRIFGQGLFCNAALLSKAADAEINLPGSKIEEPNGSVRFLSPLQAGDRVLLCSDEDQVFYILCKVVSP